MHVLFITQDKRYLKEGSQQRELLSMMTEVTESLHVVVLTLKKDGFINQRIGEKTWLYPTNSFSPLLYYFDGLSVIRRQVCWKDQLFADLILSDDPQTAGWIGMRIAGKYSRAWMVNLHTFYWDFETVPSKLLSRYTTVPLPDLLQNALRVIAFSERVAIYVQAVARTDEEKAKVVVFPEIYTSQFSEDSVDIKLRYPEFNFIVMTYFSEGDEKLLAAVRIMNLLRASYHRAGLVVVTTRQPSPYLLAQIKIANATEWVRFEVVEPESFPFVNGSIYLYLQSAEEEDTMLIRVALTGMTPIVAVRSVISESVLQDSVSGLLINAIDPTLVVSAIRQINETPGLRELFKVNAGLLERQKIIPERSDLIQRLTTYLSFPYEESPDSIDPTKEMLIQVSSDKGPLEKIKDKLQGIKDHYTKL